MFFVCLFSGKFGKENYILYGVFEGVEVLNLSIKD